MEKQAPFWTQQDFLAFLLLYAANADFEVTDDEKEMFFAKVNVKEYEHVHKAFETSNDFARLQTIQSFRERYFKDDTSREKLLTDLKEMFLADNTFTSGEKGLFMGLRRILK